MVEGADKMRQRLVKSVPEAVRAAVKDAMGKSADEIVAMARSLVPVASGKLRESIGWTFGDAPKGSLTIGEVRPVREGDVRITIYAGNNEAFYARWVEFGTQAHGLMSGANKSRGKRQGGRQHSGTNAQPFFFVSYRTNKKKAQGRITRAVNKALKAAATA
jgi:HK97 gp10 family phage protein